MKKYKFITIRQEDDEIFECMPVYRIFNNKSGGQLGIISYYKPWKQYVFSSQPECVFNDSCLRDVLDFMDSYKGGFTPRKKVSRISGAAFARSILPLDDEIENSLEDMG